MTEQEQAIRIANVVLDRPFADPDDDLAILSRALIRATEAKAEIFAELKAAHGLVAVMCEAGRDKHSGLMMRVDYMRRFKAAIAAYDAATGAKP